MGCHVTEEREKSMDNEMLQQLVEDVSERDFRKTFRHQASFNPRLRTTGGRYLLRSHNIEINEKYFLEGGMDVLVGIIKHELCHYHLHLEGDGYQHRDASFRRLLKEVGAPRFCKPLASQQEKKKKAKIVVYSCTSCTQTYQRRRRMNTNKYVCGKCKGRLKLTKEIPLG